jgi:hypothetical protein
MTASFATPLLRVTLRDGAMPIAANPQAGEYPGFSRPFRVETHAVFDADGQPFARIDPATGEWWLEEDVVCAVPRGGRRGRRPPGRER